MGPRPPKAGNLPAFAVVDQVPAFGYRGLSDEAVTDDVNRIRELLASVPEVRRAYLFGSRVRGCERRDSDWDIAVSLDAPREHRRRVRVSLTAELQLALRCDGVDLVVLEDAGPSLRFSVIRDGIPLLDRDPSKRIAFEVRAMKEYWDGAAARRAYAASLLEDLRGRRRGA